MSATVITRLTHRLSSFWRLQILGWTAYSGALFLSSVPYLGERPLLVFRIVFTLAAFLSSLLLHMLCRRLWRTRTRWLRMALWTLACSYILGHLSVSLALRSLAWAEGSAPDVFTWLFPVPSALNGVFLLLAWCAIYFGIKYYLEVEAQRRRADAAERLAREAQLRALQYQVQPHFLFNTLNAISTLVLEGEAETANRMIARLGDFFRATLNGDVHQQVPLGEELLLMELYLDIEKVRLGPRLQVEVDADDEVRNVLVPYLLLQPLVENAVRHGIAPCVKGGTISVRATRSGQHARITVTDDGNGSSPARKGLGLSNIAARLQQLYGSDHRLDIRSSPQHGCEVVIEVPFVSHALAEVIA